MNSSLSDLGLVEAVNEGLEVLRSLRICQSGLRYWEACHSCIVMPDELPVDVLVVNI